MASEFPKSFYRYSEDGAQEGKTFKSAADVEAGWLTWEEFAALPVPQKKAAPVAESGDAKKAAADLAKLRKDFDSAAKLHAEMVEAKDNVIQAQGDELVALRGFIGQLRDDVNCPAELKAAIDELLGDAEPAKAQKPKSKAKA